ncbi:MAG: prolyl oligopeptidase family serine peptidase [Steroidobacteraceae bacterium]
MFTVHLHHHPLGAYLSACALAVTLATVLAAQDSPPKARVAPVVDDYYGTKVTDPYRWMEASDNGEFKDWMKAQTDYTRAALDRIPGRAALLKRIHELDQSTSEVYGITPMANRYFYFRTVPGEAVPKVFVRDGLKGRERLLVDPTRMKLAGGHAEVGWFEPSKDGKYLAYGVAPGGAEWGEIQIVSVDSGKFLKDRVTRIWAGAGSTASWLPDNRSFTYLRFPELKPGQPQQEKQLRSVVFLHTLGTNVNGDGDPAIFGFGVNPDISVPEAAFSVVTLTPGSDYAIAGFSTVGVDWDGLYVAPLSALSGPTTPWKKLLGTKDQVNALGQLAVHGNDLYLLSHRDASRFKVLHVDLKAADLSQATVVVPQSASVIEGIGTAADGLYIQDLNGGINELRRVAYADGSEAKSVALPFKGAIRSTATSPSARGALLRMRSWNRSNEILYVDADAGSVSNTGWQAPASVDFSDIEAREVMAVSYDGTRVPLSIVLKKGSALDGSHPTLLDSYGSYGPVGTAKPTFDATSLAWLERGGIMAIAHPRGGGEFGEDWHLGGMQQTKLNTVFDTVACAEYLVDQKYSSPAKLAVSGASAGGITVGGAINWRPELFAAAIDHAGMTDTLRFETSANGPSNVPEFGSVKTEEGFHALHAMSAYANVRDGRAYPAVLLETGFNDPRVDSWIIGKMAARLQAVTSSSKPVLLRVDFDTGHFGGTQDQTDALIADEWTFLLWQFGDPEFQPAGR